MLTKVRNRVSKPYPHFPTFESLSAERAERQALIRDVTSDGFNERFPIWLRCASLAQCASRRSEDNNHLIPNHSEHSSHSHIPPFLLRFPSWTASFNWVEFAESLTFHKRGKWLLPNYHPILLQGLEVYLRPKPTDPCQQHALSNPVDSNLSSSFDSIVVLTKNILMIMMAFFANQTDLSGAVQVEAKPEP